MGEIFVDGLGIVEIAGDTPSPEEEAIIVENLAAGGIGQGLEPEEEVPIGIPSPILPKTSKGRLGIISGETRGSIRQAVEDLPMMQQLGAEISPSLIGTAGGAALGAATGPAAPIMVPLLAGAGGLLFEYGAQELGVTPNSDMALILSGAAPVAGTVVGKTFQIGRRIMGPGTAKLPPIAAARARIAGVEGTSAFDSLGGRILAKQRGLQRQPSEDLFREARRVRVTIGPEHLQNSARTMGKLQAELKQVAAMPEAAQALAIVNDSMEVLLKGKSVSFDTLIDMRQLVNNVIRRAEKAGGFKLKTSKQVFKGMADDVEKMSRSFKPTKRGARLTVEAFRKAKLEFAIRDIEAAAAQFSKPVPGKEDIVLNVDGLRKWLFNVTTKKSATFDNNFTTALRKELPGIKKILQELSEATKASGSPAGAGSIVIRGGTAKLGRTLIGGMIGFGTAGPIGAGIGGLAGASGPEMITALMMTRPGRAVLSKMVKLGKGELPRERWAILTQFLVQSTRAEPDPKKRPFSLTPLEARRRIQEQIEGVLTEDPVESLGEGREEQTNPLEEMFPGLERFNR